VLVPMPPVLVPMPPVPVPMPPVPVPMPSPAGDGRPAAGTAAELPWNFAPLASTDLASCATGWDGDGHALLPHALAGLALRQL